MWRAATAVAQCHGGGVIAVIPLLARFLPSVRTTPAAACGRSFPSLPKEGIFSAELRYRNYEANRELAEAHPTRMILRMFC